MGIVMALTPGGNSSVRIIAAWVGDVPRAGHRSAHHRQRGDPRPARRGAEISTCRGATGAWSPATTGLGQTPTMSDPEQVAAARAAGRRSTLTKPVG
jgi:hypothetical protein